MSTTRHAWPLVLAGVLAACSAKAPPPTAARATRRSTAAFTNGDFESGSIAPWVKSTYLNHALAVGNPTTRAELRLQAGGVDKTKIISGPPETVSAAGLAPGELRVPKYGNGVAVVNELGASNNVNGISQQMTVTNADVDPADGKVHIRFALAPVLQDPNHTAIDQPYFWAELKNVSQGNATLFYTFNYSNQGGVPWKTSTTGTLYTDWQSFDISPGNAQLAVGDTVELEVIAAGCAQGGHYGHVYVDGIGAFLPGLSVAAAAPSSVNTGSTLTYTLNYRNGGTGAGANVTVEETLPAGTTFASLSAPGSTCTAPAVGVAGVVTCNVGSLNPAASSSLLVTVNVTAGAGGTIANGNYRIWAEGVSPLIGPLVQTTVTSGAIYADLAITMTDGVAALTWGQADAYTLVATNNGPSGVTGATVTDVLSAQFTGATWTCAPAGGASCAASGSGDLHQTVDLPAGGSVTYLVSGNVVTGSGAGSLVNTASIAPPAGVTDNVPANDAAVDTDAIGSLYALTVQKGGSGAGTVVSSPAAISCGGGCFSQAASFLDGTQVVLTASAATGDTFTGWSGSGCSGTGATCAVTVTAATTVTASFSFPAPTTFNVTASAIGSGTITCDSPVSSGASSTCALTPAPQQYLSKLTDDGVDVTASVPGGAYVIPIVIADHVIVATFSPSVTTTALSADTASPVWGQLVTLTAAVGAFAPTGVPSGTVSFSDGATVLCAAQPISGGQATCGTATLTVEAHAFTATYCGDASYNGSASAALPLTVGQAGTTTTLAASPSPSVTGQPVILTATLAVVAPGAGAPTGTVSFSDGGTVLCAAQPIAGGQATCATPALAVGAHNFTATSSGDGSFSGSSASVTVHTITKASTTTSLASSPSPSVSGQSVTFTATLTVVAPGAGAPTGTVSFSDGGTVLCAAQPISGGQAICSIASLPVGAHGVTATYSGDGSFNGSASAASSQSVGKDTSSLTVASSRNPSRRGRPVVFTATLSAPHAALAGTVTFKDGETVLGQAALQQGQATLTTRELVKGTHAITAVYAGSTALVTASATLAGGEVVENTPPVAGAGSALDLGPASATRATVADPAGALALTTGTVELWTRPGWTSPSGVTGTPGLFRIGPADAPRLAADVSSDRKALVVRMGSNATRIPAPLDDGAWHHLALTADGTQVVAWVDGAAVGTVQGSPQAGSSTDLTLGDSFTGQLDEVRVWSKARTGEELGTAMRRPLAGDEPGLAGYWRMDEGTGAELFDASPSHLDAAVAAAQGGQAFVPSLAWRARTVWEERDLEPVAAGYDADGDALTLTLVSSPTRGAATVDQARLEVRYHAGQKQLGTDRIEFALDDGEAKGRYIVEVALERILVCQADASCGGGELCVQGACVAPSELDARSGSAGCATGGGVTPSLWMLLAAALAWARTRRAGRFPRRSSRAAALLVALIFASRAEAQVPAGFALQTFEPAPAGDPLFVVPDAEVKGHLVPAASLTLSWATEPLILRKDGTAIPGGRIVHRQLWGFLGGSLAIGDRVLLDVSAPVSLLQSGSQPFTDLAQVSGSGIGDLRLGGRVGLLSHGPWKLAGGLDVWLPSGSRDAFMSDGSVRAMPRLVGSRELGAWLIGADVGVLLRSAQDLAYTRTGTAIAFSGGAAYRWHELRVGPELYGRHQFDGTSTSPVEALVGGHWQHDALDVGAALGTAFDRAPGASPLRVILQATWRPASQAPTAAEPAAKPAPQPQATPTAPGPTPAPVIPEEKPAPAPVPAAVAPLPIGPPLAVKSGKRIELRESVRFEVDRDVLRAESEPLLRQVAAVLTENPEITKLVIEGHTDTSGRPARNLALSLRRAEAVRRWLVERGGIDAGRLEAKGFGSARPVTSNATAAGRVRNRRVELRIAAEREGAGSR